MLFALVHLNISYEGWDYRLGMIKMYDGVEILTLSCENKYVFMGTDAFGNIWVRYFIPDTSYNVIIAYLEKDYNYYALVKEYSQVDNLTLDLDNKYKEYDSFHSLEKLQMIVWDICLGRIMMVIRLKAHKLKGNLVSPELV